MNQLFKFKFISKFRYLGVGDLSQEFFIENSSVHVDISWENGCRI